MPDGVPQYKRGAEPNWFLPAIHREDGITYLGGASRLRVALDKLKKGEHGRGRRCAWEDGVGCSGWGGR